MRVHKIANVNFIKPGKKASRGTEVKKSHAILFIQSKES